MPVEKYCASKYGCFPGNGLPGILPYNSNTGSYSTLTNTKTAQYGVWTEYNNYGKMKLKNGMAVSVNVIWTKDEYKRGIGTIRVDINGNKGPNSYGYDVFFFVYDDNGIESSKFRSYMLAEQGKAGGHKENCSKDSTHENAGESCSMWIMKHNNMDYKYRDVRAEW